ISRSLRSPLDRDYLDGSIRGCWLRHPHGLLLPMCLLLVLFLGGLPKQSPLSTANY
ncbi:unnamed protein product, partial [Choristocarpus tenellus]